MHAHRPEIDGMRAIAIIPVILFHAGFEQFSGGYVGVDVFFVISGYLITSLLLNEKSNGNFSLINFYERRARRILPALFFVIFCCLPFAYCWLLPSQLKEFAQGLISISIFSSNIFFWMKSGYFVQATELNPLVHTWSLAVEEQFYIVYPLIFLLCWTTGKRRIIVALISLAVTSLILAQWSGNFQLSPPFLKSNILWFSQQEWASFYLPIGRAWELLVGALSAFYLHNHKPKSCIGNEVGTIIGLLLIFWSIFNFDKDTPFPSFYTLVPTLGAMLVILFAEESVCTGKLLSLPPFTKIGLISYSAYLWHQPLLVFSKFRSENPPDLWINGGLSALALFLAYFSWRFVETPFRNKRRFSRREIFSTALFANVLTVSIALLLIITDGARYRFTSANTFVLRLEETGTFGYTHRKCISLMSQPFVLLKDQPNVKKMLIIGDSFGCDFVNMVMEHNLLQIYQARFVYIHTHCQIYMGTELRDQFVREQHKSLCATKNDIKDAQPLIVQADVIILAASWQVWSAERLPGTIDALRLRQNQRIYVIGTKYFGKASPIPYINKPLFYLRQQRIRPHGYAMNSNQILKHRLNQSVFVDIQNLICGDDLNCPKFTPEGNFISYDGAHFTKEGAYYVGKVIFGNQPLNTLLR